MQTTKNIRFKKIYIEDSNNIKTYIAIQQIDANIVETYIYRENISSKKAYAIMQQLDRQKTKRKIGKKNTIIVQTCLD